LDLCGHRSLRETALDWRDGDREVDFVVRSGQEVVAIEVKSGTGDGRSGLAEQTVG
jgi:Holliday junction resolvase-like predicted endonuclease